MLVYVHAISFCLGDYCKRRPHARSIHIFFFFLNLWLAGSYYRPPRNTSATNGGVTERSNVVALGAIPPRGRGFEPHHDHFCPWAKSTRIYRVEAKAPPGEAQTTDLLFTVLSRLVLNHGWMNPASTHRAQSGVRMRMSESAGGVV